MGIHRRVTPRWLFVCASGSVKRDRKWLPGMDSNHEIPSRHFLETTEMLFEPVLPSDFALSRF
jgi:hypothetical protein